VEAGESRVAVQYPKALGMHVIGVDVHADKPTAPQLSGFPFSLHTIRTA
jgi:hypothetical protein